MKERNDDARANTLWGVIAYLIFTLGINALLALFGRSELMRLAGTYSAARAQQAADAENLDTADLAALRPDPTRRTHRL